MTDIVAVPGHGDVIVSPVGRTALADVVAAEHDEPLHTAAVHPATRDRLIATGLIHTHGPHLLPTDLGRRVVALLEQRSHPW